MSVPKTIIACGKQFRTYGDGWVRWHPRKEGCAAWGQSIKADEAQDLCDALCAVQLERDNNQAIYNMYFQDIGKAIGDNRMRRWTGEPSQSDAREIRNMKAELDALKAKVERLREALSSIRAYSTSNAYRDRNAGSEAVMISKIAYAALEKEPTHE